MINEIKHNNNEEDDPLAVEEIIGIVLFIIMTIAFIIFMVSSFIMEELTVKLHGTCFIIILFCGSLLKVMVENTRNK